MLLLRSSCLIMLIALFSLFLNAPCFSEELVLSRKTPVRYEFLQNSDSKELQEADHIPIAVLEDVFITGDEHNQTLVFRKGQQGYAEVFSVHPPQHFTQSGRISVHFVYIPDTTGHVHK